MKALQVTRPLFYAGRDSAAHVVLGALGKKSFLPWFLLYQFVIQYDNANGLVDSAEYLCGWLLGDLLHDPVNSSPKGSLTG